MAHLVSVKRSKQFSTAFFNLDADVGPAPAANLREDVLLVQFAFASMAADPPPDTSKEFFVAAAAVRPTGNIDIATINAIKVMQIEMRRSKPKTQVDGRLRPVTREVEGQETDSGAILDLNESIQVRNSRIWPRIDKIAGCPIELKRMVVRTVEGFDHTALQRRVTGLS
jgi:hypothetical protein